MQPLFRVQLSAKVHTNLKIDLTGAVSIIQESNVHIDVHSVFNRYITSHSAWLNWMNNVPILYWCTHTCIYYTCNNGLENIFKMYTKKKSEWRILMYMDHICQDVQTNLHSIFIQEVNKYTT